jgi:hypothetical protein
VEEPDLARAVPGAEQVQAPPPPIAARGGHEEPASSEAGQASQATRHAEEELGMQPCGDEPRRTCRGEEMLPTSGMSAGATAVATDEERRAVLKAAQLAGMRARHYAQLAAMKQQLPSLEAQLQEMWQDMRGARRSAPTKVHLRATAAVDEQLEKAETLLRSAERHLVPTEGSLTEAEGYHRSARAHLEAAEAQLTAAEAPPMSTVKAVAGALHSGEAGGQQGHHQCL